MTALPVTTPAGRDEPRSRPTIFGVRAPSRVLSAALGLALVADVFFYDKPLGVSVLLFTLLLLGTLWGLARHEGVTATRSNLWPVPPLLFFAAMVFVRANAFLTFLNVTACLVLFSLLASFWAAGRIERLGLPAFLGVPLKAAGNALYRAAPLLPASVDFQAARERGGRGLLPLLRGLFIALPILFLFGTLLASADLVFARYLEHVTSLDITPAMEAVLRRAVTVLCVTWLLGGLFVYALVRAAEKVPEAPPVSLPAAMRLGFVETATVLCSVNALFLLFVAVQFAYLFGGSANVVTAEGFTYAEYARRGFFELLAVSVLTLALILGLHHVVNRDSKVKVAAFNAMGSLLVGLTLILLGSAMKRMLLYEAAYGYTELRLTVHVFMIWLAVTFVWFLVTLWRRTIPFAIGAFAAGLGFLATLNVLNPDAYITRQNLARYEATRHIDVDYLLSLSEDALPQIVRAAPRLPAFAVRWSDTYLVSDRLKERTQQLERDQAAGGWSAFHLARWRAYKALTEMPGL